METPQAVIPADAYVSFGRKNRGERSRALPGSYAQGPVAVVMNQRLRDNPLSA
jgi:hypothetical protein